MKMLRASTIGIILLTTGVPRADAQQDPARRFDAEVRLMSWADLSEQQTTAAGQPGHVTDFLVRRARLSVQARVSDRISASFQIGQDNIGGRLLTPDSGITIKDAYVNLRATNVFQLAVGQFKVPFLRANLESGFNQLLVDRGTLSGFRPAREGSRDIGAMAWGNVRRTQYRVAVFGGSDQDLATAGGNIRLTARVAHNWFTAENGLGYSGTSIGSSRVLQVAAQADLQNTRVDSRDDASFRQLGRDYRAYALEAFVEYPIGRWAVTGEGAWLARDDHYVQALMPTREIRGSYAQAGLLLPPGPGAGRLQIGARREDWRTERDPASTDNDRTTVGGTYFISGHRRKVQADYSVKREEPEISNDEFRLSLVMVF
jgi:hypothetical protein